jgi:hypothetical protein
MTKNQITYTSLAAVFIISLSVVIFVTREIIQIFAGIPLVVSLVAVLYQIMRDQVTHDRALLAMDHQNRFALGASSHMANVAFDKHVEFCEEYVKAALEALQSIYRAGPSQDQLKHSAKLLSVREKYAVWITSKIEEDLQPFETALRQMGASAGYVDSTTGDPSATQRQQHINLMYTILAKITNQKEWEGQELTDELAVSTLIRRLRAILGTEELNEMRHTLVAKAVKELRR